MTRDPRTTTDDPRDDAAIGQLVRDVAEGWTMPPIRLDAPSWRERVRSPRARRVASVRGFLGRAGQAATAAVALTVAGALVAVLLTRPPSLPGKSAEPSTGTTPGASPAVNASPLPKLFVDGEVPAPTGLVVRLEQGNFAVVDLAKGAIGSAMTDASYGSTVTVRADGTVVCLCLVEARPVDFMPTEATVSLLRFDASGEQLSDKPIETFTGTPDPRDTGVVVPERPPHVLTKLGFSADGRYGFVGWSKRVAPAWQSGVLVVDLDDGAIVSRLDLPDERTGEGDARRVIDAPMVVGNAPFLRVLISRSWYGWHPVTSENATYDVGSETFAAGFKGGDLTGAASLAGAADCGEVVVRGGIAGGGSWIACQRGGGSVTVIRRLGPDGSQLEDVQVLGIGGLDGDLTAVSPDDAFLFAWNPVSATLTRVDLSTGETATGQGPVVTAMERSPLSALGAWLAPTVAAKSFLRGGMVISPDGSRVYALGIENPASEQFSGGSTGVYAFDASSMANLGQWPPTADFVSLAMSADGRFVYAAGLPGVTASGTELSSQPASITVFDARDGTLRLIAGALGRDVITFGATVFD